MVTTLQALWNFLTFFWLFATLLPMFRYCFKNASDSSLSNKILKQAIKGPQQAIEQWCSGCSPKREASDEQFLLTLPWHFPNFWSISRMCHPLSVTFLYSFVSLAADLLSLSGHIWYAFIMAALCNRCGHYIFALLFLSFFPRLISAVGDWMSTILPHMVWP